MNREIPIVDDFVVDREFGTGAVKVTPAHDPNDFEIGRRHNLPEIDVMTDDAKMSAAAGKYAGLDRFEARKRVVADLEAAGLLEKIADHTHAVGTCDRCGTIIEPRASTQWFVKMKPLAEPAIAAVERGDIEIMPDNRRTEYFEWMRNIRDWCISRQLWWGHRIPAWYCGDCKEIIVARAGAVEMREVRLEQIDAGPGRARDLVQLRAVALFHDGLAGRHAGLPQILSDQPAHHRVRHSFLLGRAHDHDGPEIYRASSLPPGLDALDRAQRRRPEDVEVQGNGNRSRRAE